MTNTIPIDNISKIIHNIGNKISIKFGIDNIEMIEYIDTILKDIILEQQYELEDDLPEEITMDKLTEMFKTCKLPELRNIAKQYGITNCNNDTKKVLQKKMQGLLPHYEDNE